MKIALGTDAEVTSPLEIAELRARIEREERLAGLAPDGFVTAAEIRARRGQILAVMALVLARREDLARRGRSELLDHIDAHAVRLLREVG